MLCLRLSQFAGSILLPFANRIANGTYTFFGSTHHLPRNECPAGVRCDALHGFLFNRTLDVVRSDVGDDYASLTLGTYFDGISTPGWPFRAFVEVTYALTVHDPHAHEPGPGVAYITTKVTNAEPASSLPFFNSWHPYFRVKDVSRARIEFDVCGGASNSTSWRHVVMGAGGKHRSSNAQWQALHPLGLEARFLATGRAPPISGAAADATADTARRSHLCAT